MLFKAPILISAGLFVRLVSRGPMAIHVLLIGRLVYLVLLTIRVSLSAAFWQVVGVVRVITAQVVCAVLVQRAVVRVWVIVVLVGLLVSIVAKFGLGFDRVGEAVLIVVIVKVAIIVRVVEFVVIVSIVIVLVVAIVVVVIVVFIAVVVRDVILKLFLLFLSVLPTFLFKAFLEVRLGIGRLIRLLLLKLRFIVRVLGGLPCILILQHLLVL